MSKIANPGSAPPPTSLGMARLTAMAFRGEPLTRPALTLLERINTDPDDAAAMLDLGTLHMLMGQGQAGLTYQAMALSKQRLYSDGTAGQGDGGVRLLAFAAPGDLMANVPIPFLVENSDIRLDVMYVVPGQELPATVPDHDLAMVIVGESDENRPILERIAGFVGQWPRPVLNDPRRVLGLSRDGVSALLAGAEGICIPATACVDHASLERLSRGEVPLTSLVADGAFPIILRPRDSHAGKGLAKLDEAAAIAGYLAEQRSDHYYLSSFVDYSGADGLFRKYRIALIEGRPFVCHMAVSGRWMVHYLNADMKDSQAKRDEEAQAFASFDQDFASRHEGAFQTLAARVGLDYFAIDCAETRDGRLLLFEVDTAMIVHAMDSPDLFPYKPPQMRRIFRAFQEMLRVRAGKA